MSLFPSVKRQGWRMTDAEAKSADAEFQKARPDAMVRGKNTCVFCGFRDKAMEVHHWNDLHHDNRPENLKVVCPICHSVCHVGQVATQKHGAFGYLPGMTAAHFSCLLRTINYVLFRGTPEQKEQALAVLENLRASAGPVAEAWGTTKLGDFAETLLRLSATDYAKRESILAHLLLVMEPERFEKFTESWAETAFKKLPMDTWGYLYEQIQAKARSDNTGGGTGG